MANEENLIPVTGMMAPTAEAGANKLVLSGNKFRFEAVI